MASTKKRQLPSPQVTKVASFSTSSVQNIRKENRLLEICLCLFSSCVIILSCFSAPEGDIRDGDFLPIALFICLFSVGLALVAYRVFRRTEASVSDTGTEETLEVKQSKFNWRIIADVSLGVFALLATVSYLREVFFHTGDVRFATNAYWTFIIPAFIFFIFRLFSDFFSSRLIVGISVVLFGCALAESVFAVYSYAWLNPQLREAYLENPDQMLRENGLNFAPDSHERILFENRLLKSFEPNGTYGLANTLAGFLAPVFIVGLFGVFWGIEFVQKARQGVVNKKERVCGALAFLFWSFCLFLILIVLVLTKSRSGFLALFFGLFLLGLLIGWTELKRNPKYAKYMYGCFLGAVAFGVSLLIGAFACGIIDREVFTEAGKSLGYRLDYWRATGRMIADYPILGIGPGEFQNIYPHYILPTASEFIADPHNFVFEIAALFGIPALGAFLLFLLAVFASAAGVKNEEKEGTFPDGKRSMCFKDALLGILIGLLVLLLCSFFQCTPVSSLFLWIAFAALLIVAAVGLVLSGFADVPKRFTVLLASVSLATLLLNICVAGGIGYPAISVPLFVLAAICVNANVSTARQTARQRAVWTGKKGSSVFLLFSVVVLLTFYSTAFKPRLNSYLFMLKYDPTSVGLVNPYVNDLKSGSTEHIDAYSTSVASQFYYYAALEYSKSHNEQDKMRWQNMRNHVKEVSPNSAIVRESCGDFDWTLFCRDKRTNGDFLDSAAEFYRDSTIFSPTEVGKRLKLFRAYKEQNRTDDALAEARIALELDKITPHEDRKLSEESRDELQNFVTANSSNEEGAVEFQK